MFSLGSKTESTVSARISLRIRWTHALVQYRPLAASLISYVKSLQITSEIKGYDLQTLTEDLISQAKSNLTSNVIVLPVLQTFNVLLEGDALTKIFDDHVGCRRS